MFALFWLLLLVTRTPVWASENPSPVLLSSDTTLSSEGYFVLSWVAPSDIGGLSLQQEAGPNATANDIRAERLVASGSITITGLVDGDYTYRLLADNQPSSNSVTIKVQHHSLLRALGFFGLGLVLFGILVGTIVIGNARTRSEHVHAD